MIRFPNRIEISGVLALFKKPEPKNEIEQFLSHVVLDVEISVIKLKIEFISSSYS